VDKEKWQKDSFFVNQGAGSTKLISDFTAPLSFHFEFKFLFFSAYPREKERIIIFSQIL